MELSKLFKIMDSIIGLLEKYGVDEWHSIISTNKAQLIQAVKSGDNKRIRSSLEQILSLYGGMGSFNDVFISNQAGYQILRRDVSRVNRDFQKLSSNLYVSLKEEIDRLNKTEAKSISI